MDELFDLIKVGGSVDIQRTDGRIHSAVVSGINTTTRSVTVEWFERGETKGKEIELDAILALNPDLIPAQPTENVRTLPSKLPAPSRASVAIVPNNKGGSVSTRSTRQSQAAHVLLANQNNLAFSQNGPQTAVAHRAVESMMPPPPPAPVVAQPAPSVVAPPGGTVTRQSAMNPQGGGAAARRRSNVVKEVERLEKNREERRARQAEIKEEKKALMNMDPGNVNWEFLSMIREFQATLEFRPIRDTDGVEDHQITVCVRKRPLNKKELARKEVDVITVPSKDRIIVHEPKTKVDLTKYLENQNFRFDYAFDDSCDNEKVYKYSAKPLVQTIFEGGMATCFAYGQTGSGKTHTMGGDFQGKTQDCSTGIYAKTARDVFKLLKSPKYRTLDLVVSASFFEIYSGKVFDLLNGKAKLRVLEDGKQQVQLVGLCERSVDSVEEVLKLIQHGNGVRTSGSTSANAHSSRSHAVFQVILRPRASTRLHGKFSLVDLAGNERGADTSSANRQTRMEGAEINKSLLALKECIRALGRKGAHLPFRASKLTQVLRDSFIGEKSKTCMIAMISPGLMSCEHSLNTLRYADRVKELAADPLDAGGKASPTVIDTGTISPLIEEDGQDDDLAQLRSLNEGELSADLYTFHEAVSHLQEMEEDVLDSHKLVLDQIPKWHQACATLLAMTNEVDYDVDAYVQQMEDILAEAGEGFLRLKSKVSVFRAELQAEEEMSRNIKEANPTRNGRLQ
ncbi:LOW QUALITY PROTEIN: kinesin-like protein KIF2A [Daphnia magna]|uniref:LOW QUALITY PROTEIN: kinesin-like protein KIF2A n=1 Tax=Daphnia magna TaxID=35525 RepID=UPI001E1BC259|nr:LOW QUALITY PROTEIN: kinesin-like protein KIF2A [Daphnia magna]